MLYSKSFSGATFDRQLQILNWDVHSGKAVGESQFIVLHELLTQPDSMDSSPGGVALLPYLGFGILELAGGLVPQGGLVKTARAGWKFIWLQMMRELAPQSPDGSYVRYGSQLSALHTQGLLLIFGHHFVHFVHV